MRIRTLDISDKRPHSAAPDWSQADIESPKPQKIAQMFFIVTQLRPDGLPLLSYAGKHASPEFPWRQPNPGGAGQGFDEYSDEDVRVSLRIWMLQTFEHSIPITKGLVEDVLSMLAAICVKASKDRGSKEHA